MGHATHRLHQSQQAHAQAQFQGQPNGSPVDLPVLQRDIQRDWTALGVLAEVSRQIDLNEKNDDRVQPNTATASSSQADLTAEQPAPADSSRDLKVENTATDSELPKGAERVPTEEERLQEILGNATDSNNDPSNISMAAAATARLVHPALLDPQLLGQEAAAAAEAATATATAAAVAAESTLATTAEQAPASETPLIPTTGPSQPWGEITYTTDTFQVMPPTESMAQNAVPMNKGGFRLETNGLTGAKSRHSRARFNATRRKQVQEVRKIGACIRCRVLRKTCSQGQPCDTCRKVLSPRVWRSGCVRTKFSEQLDLYSAGVQIVLAQGRINVYKQGMALGNHGLHIEASHFPEQEYKLRLQVLQRDGIRDPDGKVEPTPPGEGPTHYPVILVDNDSQDVPAKVEMYMREVLPELIKREPSHFMQVTLQTALELASTTNDELLKKSLELWGLVEILDRERQWTICVKANLEDSPPVSHIKEDKDQEVFTTICLQLAAAAERKAAATSKTLLTGMQRVLQDSKVKIDYSMYFATLILLNCVEKSTWAFKAWEQPNLRGMWPLEKEPGSFAQQGYVIANLLRMLLGIRKALPRTACRESDGKLVTEEQDPAIQHYFETVNLDCKFPPFRPVSVIGELHKFVACARLTIWIVAAIKSKQEQPVFSPTDPRSFEFLFCSTLLLPAAE